MNVESLLRRASAYALTQQEFCEEKINVVVVGVGGAGCNAVNRMKKLGLSAPTIAINTDMAHLMSIEADKKILLKKGTRGLGAGGVVERGESSALLARKEIAEFFKDVDVAFITTGLGGGTGTGATPVIAEIARDSGALVITIATLPFKIERARFSRAKEGLRRIMKFSNTVIVLENDKLMKIVPNLPLQKAFMVMDQLVSYTIISFIDVLTKPSLMNVDLADLRRLMVSGHFSTILIGEGDAYDPRKIVVDALNRPLIMDMDYSKAKGGLIHITTGENVSISKVHDAIDAISSILQDDSNIIIGARIDPEFGDRMLVLVILTDIKIPLLEGHYEIDMRKSEKNLDLDTVR